MLKKSNRWQEIEAMQKNKFPEIGDRVWEWLVSDSIVDAFSGAQYDIFKIILEENANRVMEYFARKDKTKKKEVECRRQF